MCGNLRMSVTKSMGKLFLNQRGKLGLSMQGILNYIHTRTYGPSALRRSLRLQGFIFEILSKDSDNGKKTSAKNEKKYFERNSNILNVRCPLIYQLLHWLS